MNDKRRYSPEVRERAIRMVREHRDVYGVEPICQQLPIAASTYYEYKVCQACPERLSDRPNQLWVADFTYVPTWAGFVYTAFVIDVFAKRIVGWKTARSMTTSLVLDALEHALHARGDRNGLIHHSDRGCRYRRLGRIDRQLLRQRAGRDYHRALQDRGHPPPRALTRGEPGRIRHADLG